MGTWGTSISANDTFADIYDEFFELYNEGFEVNDISKRLFTENQEIINDAYDSDNFWFALAKAKWECKQLDGELYGRVKNIIDTGADIEVWRQLDATEKDLKKRKIVLDKFLADISVQKAKTRARRKKRSPKTYNPVFQKGDCITFKLANGNYGGAVALEALYDWTNRFVNLIAATRIDQPNKPALKDFERAEVLVKNFALWNESPSIDWYNPVKHQNIINLIEIVGQTDIEIIYTQYTDSSSYINKTATFGFMDNFDGWIIGQINRQFEFEKSNNGPSRKLKITELTKVK